MSKTQTRDIEELDQERENREINKGTFSILVGYETSQGWAQAVKNNRRPTDKIKRAEWVLDYHDEYGYVPDPREVP